MLRMEHLQKNYGAFHLDVSLEVQPGCVTGLAGMNGAGKSTVFKAALGLIRPEGGSVRMFGKEVRGLSREDKQRTGVVLTDSGFSGYLTLRDLSPVLAGFYPGFDRAFFQEQCRRFHLPEKKPIREFSTGMKAQLKLLAAVSHRPSLLVLDEPTAGLDVLARDGVLEILREFMEGDESRAILISSHIASDLEGLCDDFYLIDKGQILLHEETDILLGRYALLKMTQEQYEALDRQYVLQVKREPYGYCALTDQRQFYMENYPELVTEKSGIDDLMRMLAHSDLRGKGKNQGIYAGICKGGAEG